jgi:predicted dehydrogenase
VFESEPLEVVSAVGTKHPDSGFDQNFDDTVSVTLRFPNERLAQFTVSYYGNAVNSLLAIGTKGSIQLDPAYVFGRPLKQTTTIGEKEKSETFKNTDHFGGELKYFSDCILKNLEPEPDGEEGYADVRVLEGVLQALKNKSSVTLKPFMRSRRIDTDLQRMTLGAVSTPELVNASNPGKDIDKNKLN